MNKLEKHIAALNNWYSVDLKTGQYNTNNNVYGWQALPTFIHLLDGCVKLLDYRLQHASVTDLEDLTKAWLNDSSENLVTTLLNYNN